MPDNFVRVKDPDTGHEFTTGREAAEILGLTILADKPAVDVSGRPLPAKPNETVAAIVARKSATDTANKEG